MTIKTPADAIELLGGRRVVSQRIGRPFTTVASWVVRQSIPIEVWAELVEFASEKRIKGFTYEAIVKAHAQSPAPKRKAAA